MIQYSIKNIINRNTFILTFITHYDKFDTNKCTMDRFDVIMTILNEIDT